MKSNDSWNYRVLIVDDQEEIHNDFEEMLASGSTKRATDELAAAFVAQSDKPVLPQFELSHAASGEEACAMVKAAQESNRPFALAYIDVRMPPGTDGVETVRQIRQFEQDIEIVIMTAYSDKTLPEIVNDMELLHKLLYIRKPFSREEIQQITLSLTGKWNIEQELAKHQWELEDSNQQLESSNQRLQAVLDATGDAIGMFDADGRLQVANQGYEKLLEATESELKQMSPSDLMARIGERLRPPALPELGRELFLDSAGDLEEEVSEAGDSTPRLFYRSTAPVRDMGHIVMYRDVSKEVESEQMKAEVLRLRSELGTTYAFDGMVGKSKNMQDVYALMQRAAESDITVLVQGESGTGKELVAKLIHYNSPRKTGPFVAVNCAAIPETLIESELFGHERGAFTGASTRRIGQFEHAQGGTVLLDEIGDMPLALQAKLLRILEEREIQRVGGTATIPIDIRVIAATNRDLESAVKDGGFRADLFYRLAAFPLVIPSLREHREDIPLLAAYFLQDYAERADESTRGISPAALQVLIAYDWPGNVRELRNAIERALLLETTDRLQVSNLPPQLAAVVPSPTGSEDSPQPLSLQQAEQQAVVRALEASEWNITKAAQVLNVNRVTLYRKLKKYDLLAQK
ncbi:MAG: sigma 54-interacting transcriptional regulator [Gemmatimonadota bacterium]|nr:sigma 54-interacting transcriptional regulator [Gemmatimonadota bacterium]